MLHVIRTARSMLFEKGRVTEATQLLAQHRLSRLHTQMWNPFLALPHVDCKCFPADRLHEMYVLLLSMRRFGFLANRRSIAHLAHCTGSDLGIIKLVIDAIRHAIKSQHAIEAVATRLLHSLSLRVQKLTAALPGSLPTVYGLFQETGPSVQGSHYRCVQRRSLLTSNHLCKWSQFCQPLAMVQRCRSCAGSRIGRPRRYLSGPCICSPGMACSRLEAPSCCGR